MFIPNRQGLDLKDGEAMWVYLESLRAWFQDEQSTWLPHWRQLARYFLPRSPRFTPDDRDTGWRRDGMLVDNTGTLALSTLTAGLFSGTCSPSSTWFMLESTDEKANKLSEVRDYHAEVADILRSAFLRSNCYQVVHGEIANLATYGTSCWQLLEDEQDDMRAYAFPLGSYFLSGNHTQRIDIVMRVVSMTARQIVDQYGFKNCSSAVQAYYTSNAGGMKEQWWQVVQALMPSSYFGTQGDPFPIMSIHYELQARNDHGPKEKRSLLKRGGYYESPCIASRWDVTGEDFYGKSPCMVALGDQMGLQLLRKRISEANDKRVNPPMVADPMMLNQKTSILPGHVTYADTTNGRAGFKPAYQVNWDTTGALQEAEEHKKRIQRALHEDLFLMISESDRRQITAEEIRAKQQEKMLVLGPVLERLSDEFFKPWIFRGLNILERRHKLPPRPAALQKHDTRIVFSSILSAAQRALKVAAIDKLVAFVGGQVATNPAVLDVFNIDKINRTYADDLGTDPQFQNSEKDVAAIRAQRAKAAQQQQAAAQAKDLAGAAQTLSNTDVRTPSALQNILQAQQGQAPA
jgi:hypothetical protein